MKNSTKNFSSHNTLAAFLCCNAKIAHGEETVYIQHGVEIV